MDFVRVTVRRRGRWGAVTIVSGLAGLVLAVAGLLTLTGGGASRAIVSTGIALMAVGGFAALAPARPARPTRQ